MTQPETPAETCGCIKADRLRATWTNPTNCWGETWCKQCKKHIHWGVRPTGQD